MPTLQMPMAPHGYWPCRHLQAWNYKIFIKLRTYTFVVYFLCWRIRGGRPRMPARRVTCPIQAFPAHRLLFLAFVQKRAHMGKIRAHGRHMARRHAGAGREKQRKRGKKWKTRIKTGQKKRTLKKSAIRLASKCTSFLTHVGNMMAHI